MRDDFGLFTSVCAQMPSPESWNSELSSVASGSYRFDTETCFLHIIPLQHRPDQCARPCLKLLYCGHPCMKLCGDACGACMLPLASLELPCGHTAINAPCHQSETPSSVICTVVVDRILSCGRHSKRLLCGVDPASVPCDEKCGGTLDCVHAR